MIVGAAKRLPIDSYDSLDPVTQPLDPGRETSFQLSRIKQGKKPPKGIMGGNPIGKHEHLSEPGFFRLAKFFDFHPALGSTDRGANSDDEAISEPMPFRSFDARVLSLS